ncbi:hypothetical protein, partial [Chromobacterium sp. LK1]|uniref:hypothetical protein n=1 Tax=Chromobacterium sp. LK1 TaxID=1628193 RepID=UPI001E341586
YRAPRPKRRLSVRQRHDAIKKPPPGSSRRRFGFACGAALGLVQRLASKGETRRKRAKKRNVQVVHEHFELVLTV